MSDTPESAAEVSSGAGGTALLVATDSRRERNTTAALTGCSFTNSRVAISNATLAAATEGHTCGDVGDAMLATVVTLRSNALVRLTDSTFRENMHALGCADILADASFDYDAASEDTEAAPPLPAVYSNARPPPQVLKLTRNGSQQEAAQRAPQSADAQFLSGSDPALQRIEQARCLRSSFARVACAHVLHLRAWREQSVFAAQSQRCFARDRRVLEAEV